MDIHSSFPGITGAVTRERVPMAGFTTWKVGGPARFLVEVSTRGALEAVLEIAGSSGTGLYLLGNGSNLLVSDRGLDGVVVRLSGELAALRWEGSGLIAGAGAMLGSVCIEACRRGLSGLEFSSGIPATVGGAVMTNAGAFGRSIAGVVREVEVIRGDGTAARRSGFSGEYREPLVPAGEVVLRAHIALVPSGPQEVAAGMEEVRSKRRKAQPRGVATAGSVFKNPPGKPAGALIEKCGLKGEARGGARISMVHANFIENTGGATAGDILYLMKLARRRVEETFGVRLEPEVELLGFGEVNWLA